MIRTVLHFLLYKKLVLQGHTGASRVDAGTISSEIPRQDPDSCRKMGEGSIHFRGM